MIPANIIIELTSIIDQVNAAEPLANASRATIIALQLNGSKIVSDIQTALVAPNNTLDVWVAPVDPAGIIQGVLGLVTAATDQSNLSLMRGTAGRATSNLDQMT